MIQVFLQKTAALFSYLEKYNTHVELSEQLNKDIKVVVYSLTNVQQLFPLAFITVFQDYMALIELIMNNPRAFKNELVLKAALLGLLKVLKTFPYYAEPSNFAHSLT